MSDTMLKAAVAGLFYDPSLPSFQVVIDSISTHPGLSKKQRADLLCSCRRLPTLLEQQAELIPAHPRYIRDRLKEVFPPDHEISSHRLRNIRRDVLHSLELVGLGKTRSYLAPLSPEWESIWDRIVNEQDRWRLSRAFRMFSSMNVSPSGVTAEHWAVFKNALIQEEENGAIDSAGSTYRGACGAWDRVNKFIPALPTFVVSEPRQRNGYTFRLEQFPESFQTDVRAWLRNLRPDDDHLFSPGAVRTPLRPRTVNFMRFRVLQFASAGVLAGHKRLDEITSLSVLVEMEFYKAALRWLVNRLGKTESNLRLAQMIRSMGRHHLAPRRPENPDPGTEQKYLQAMAAHEAHIAILMDLGTRVGKKNVGVSDKNERRLLKFDDPANVDAFLNLPQTFAEAALQTGRTRDGALLMQAAVMTEILIMCQLRLTNLASISMSRHLNCTRAAGAVHLVFPPEEMKNGESLVKELPLESMVLIDDYIDNWRPLLVDKPNDWLFPGRKDRHKCAGFISTQLPRLIWKHSGLEINVHLVRAITVSIYAAEHPEDVETPTHALGHRDPSTIVYYKRLNTRGATKRFSQVILARRHGCQPTAQ